MGEDAPCLCVCVSLSLSVYIHGGQKLILGVFFIHSPLYIFETSSLINPEAQ